MLVLGLALESVTLASSSGFNQQLSPHGQPQTAASCTLMSRESQARPSRSSHCSFLSSFSQQKPHPMKHVCCARLADKVENILKVFVWHLSLDTFFFFGQLIQLYCRRCIEILSYYVLQSWFVICDADQLWLVSTFLTLTANTLFVFPNNQVIYNDCLCSLHLLWLPIVHAHLSLKQSLNILSKLSQLLKLTLIGGRAGGLTIITSRAWSLTCFCISKFLLGEKHSIGNCCLAFCGNVNSTLLIGSKMFLML